MDNSRRVYLKLIGVLIGGAIAALTFVLLSGYAALDLVKGMIVGAIALLVSELFAGLVDSAWKKGLLFGFMGGVTLSILSYLLFNFDKGFAEHTVPILVGALAGGFIYQLLAKKQNAKAAA